jgi:aminomethyltransferase
MKNGGVHVENVKRTSLYENHLKSGGKIVTFAGYQLPIQYEGIIEEHNAVRGAAGLFDVSHMGEIQVKGKDALKYLQHMLTNDLSKLVNNQVIYSLMCYENGGVVDDLLVYKYDDEYYYLVVNASNKEKDYAWLKDNIGSFNVNLIDISESISEVALQGPKAEEILQKLVDQDLSGIKFFCFRQDMNLSGINVMISRTGYTGEDGFEIYSDNEGIKKVWSEILNSGKDLGVMPAGLGCRDTLRFEANLPLYGDELSKDITPLEAGYGFFVKLDKEDFIGREALKKQKEEGLKRKIVGFKMEDRGIPRHGYLVFSEDKEIGFVTTGYYSPTLKENIGLAMVDTAHSNLGDEIYIQVRNKQLKAKVVSRKFLAKNYKK